MSRISEIYDYIDSFAPFETAESYDNVGLLIGDGNRDVSKVLLSLDITEAVVKEAVEMGASLIVSHHPVIFNPLKRIGFESVPALLIKNEISAICAHTNLDKSAQFGVNLTLAKACGLENCKPSDIDGCLFIANTKEPLSAVDFAKQINIGTKSELVAYTDCGKMISKVGLCSGAGGEFVFAAAKLGCDAFVTGEIKHHEILAANASGISVYSIGHYRSEDVVIEPLTKLLGKKFPDVQFAKSQKFSDGIKFI